MQSSRVNYELRQRRRKAREKEAKPEINPFNLEKILFPEQLAFVRDPNPFATALCSRRAGKTVGCAADLIDVCLATPDITCAYITISRKTAKGIVWPTLKQLKRDYNLEAVFHNTDLTVTFSNGSRIMLAGAKSVEEIEKLRGLALKKVYLDEMQSFKSYVKELIDDIICPALMDYGGSLRLIGTPGPIPSGYFYQMCKSEAYSHHEWTYFQNPYIAIKSGMSHEQLLTRELKRRGVPITHPSIQREWFGKWVLDSDSLILHYNPEKNDFSTIPSVITNYVLGVDIGLDDSDAFALLAYNEHSRKVWLVEEILAAKQDISSLTAQIQYLRNKYTISKIVIDTGGLGKKIAEELQRRHNIPLQAADKARKMENLALLDDALRTSQFMARAGGSFAQDCNMVEIDRDRSTSDRLIVSDRYHSDICDAVLYAFKECSAWSFQAETPKPKPGTKEWFEQEVNRMEENEFERLKEQEDATKRGNEGGWY